MDQESARVGMVALFTVLNLACVTLAYYIGLRTGREEKK